MNYKPFFIAVTLLALAAILPGASMAIAQAPQPASGTIPYQGQLSDSAGQPVPDGAYDFTFALYNAPDGDNLLWSETQNGVVVQNGAFTALLGSVSPLPEEIQANGGHWLAVGVRGPGEAEFTALDRRQELSEGTTSATATAACPHDHFGETWTGTGVALNLTSDGYGGETLYVNTTGSYDGVRAYSNGTDLSDAALKGTNLSTGTGVSGSSNGGIGVRANNASNTGTALSISQGAFRVEGAGVGTSTTVFIHQAQTGAGGNMCPSLANTTVINNPLTNGDPNAILIITINGGTMGSVVAPNSPQMAVSYDTNNMCGFGQRWLIANLSYNAIPNGAKFNVLVVKP